MQPSISSHNEHRRRYAEAIRQARQEGLNSFHSWFNTSGSVRESIVRGYWDFAFYILTREVCTYLVKPEDKTALEIGYGGGRLLNAACSYFREAIGIDIHDEQDTVEALLREEGKTNFRLIPTSGDAIDVDSESVDFVYSFIVLQHLPSFRAFETYLKETYRCLKPNGVAQLYFGRYTSIHPAHQIRHCVCGYMEIPTAPVNHISLVVRVGKAKALCRALGFKILQVGTSYRHLTDRLRTVRGKQSFVTLLKG